MKKFPLFCHKEDITVYCLLLADGQRHRFYFSLKCQNQGDFPNRVLNTRGKFLEWVTPQVELG